MATETKNRTGFLTTEFWITAITMVLGITGTIPLPPFVYPLLALGYTACRTLVKIGVIRGKLSDLIKKLEGVMPKPE